VGQLTRGPFRSGAAWDARAASDIPPPEGESLRVTDLGNTPREDLERRRLEEMGGATLEPRFETQDDRQHSVRVD
jgi:hypothetical protein